MTFAGTHQPSRTPLYIALITLSATLLSLCMLTRDNGWGDDFAGYILQAQSIVRGNMAEDVARSVFTIENSSYNVNPANYPWGFPLMLAPAFAIFGTKVLALKLVLTLSHALLVLASFLLARTRLHVRDSLILAAVIGYNAVLIAEGQGEVLSDIPFSAFSIFALWLIVHPVPDTSTHRADLARSVLIGLAIFATAFIRPNGFLLILVLIVRHLSELLGRDSTTRRRALLAILAPAITLGLLYALQSVTFPTVSLRKVSFSLAPADLSAMFIYYLQLPAYFFHHFGAAAWAIYGLQIILVLLSLLAHWKRDLPLHTYVIVSLLMYVTYPYKQGIRYLYPLWPLMLLFTFDGIRAAAHRLRPTQGRIWLASLHLGWGAIALLSLAICVDQAWVNVAANRSGPGRNTGAFSAGTTEMFDFVSDHTPADSVVIFFKPRALRLRTDRDSFLTTNCSDLVKADYVITLDIAGTHDQIEPDRVQKCNPAVVLSPVYEKDLFIVYQIRPAGAG